MTSLAEQCRLNATYCRRMAMLAATSTEESQFNRRAERWQRLAAELDQQRGLTQELFRHAAVG